jgi:hypothetical protein
MSIRETSFKQTPMTKELGVRCQVTGFSAAADLKSGQSNRKINSKKANIE